MERDRELGELATVIGRACEGTGGLVAIEGDAGLGKTCLLQAARDLGAEAGMSVLTARATELERDFPFALVRQLFDSPLADMPAAQRDALFDGAGAARSAFGSSDGAWGESADVFSVLHGLYWVTAALADRRPLLLAIDDVHWADAASVDYLGFLLPRLEELPVLVVVACRPDDPDASGRLAEIVTDSSAQRLTPSALTPEAAGMLLAVEMGEPSDAEFAATCHEVSGGNPFLLTELARTLVTRGIAPRADRAELVRELAPERVARMVLARLARLSREACAVARALAVLGDDTDHRLVAALAATEPDAVGDAADALRAAAILDAGSSLRFIHPLVRNAVYSDLRAGERSAAHGRAAVLLRGDGATPEQIATHLVLSDACGDREVVEILLDAGTRALDSGAPRSAIAYLTRALRESPPADARAAVLQPLITASIRAADHLAYDAIESDVLAELERNPHLRSRWAKRLTIWMALNGRFEQAVTLLRQAIDVAVDEEDIERAFRLEAQLITLAHLPPAVARARLERYRGRIEPDSASGRLEAAFDSYWCALDGHATKASELARRALRGGRIFAEQPELWAPGGAVHVLLLANDIDAAERAAERALAIAQERGSTPELVGARFLCGAVASGRGDLQAAEADARQATDLARLGGFVFALPPAIGLLVDILIERGELEAAEAELGAVGVARGEIPDIPAVHVLLFERGRLRLEQGEPHEAVADLLELERRRERLGIGAAPLMQTGPYAAQALVQLGERERARDLAERDVVHARRWGAPNVLSRALRALGLAVGGSAGRDLLREAAAILEDRPAPLFRAHALTDLGAALRRDNRRAEAREPLREALELARRCGAAGLAKRAHDELQATGERVRRYTPIGVESLTASERRVAEMAASGKTNREIAQTLFLTVKTIETHLSAAYDKLDIRSRRQLPDALTS